MRMPEHITEACPECRCKEDHPNFLSDEDEYYHQTIRQQAIEDCKEACIEALVNAKWTTGISHQISVIKSVEVK